MEPETLQIKPGDTLSGIAQQRGTTVNALLGANPNITNPDLIIAGQSLKLPSNMNTVQAETLQQAPQGVSVPEAAQVAQPEPFVQSLQTVEPDFFTQQLEQAQSQQNAVEAERTALTDRLQGLLGKLTGRGERAQELTEESGLPQAQRELQDVTKQIAQLRGEFERAINVSEDRLAPTTAIRGEQAAIRRQQAVEIGAMSAMAQALQGNIQLAQQTIDRAIEFEFQPIEQEIQNTMMFLELNNQNFSRAEKRRAESMEQLLMERQARIKEQKEQKSFILNTMVTAAQNGADQETIESIRNATDPEQAVEIASQALGAPFREQQEQQLFQNKIAMRNLQINEAQLKLAQNKFEIEKQQRTSDIENGILTSEQINDIDKSPQGESLKVLGDFAIKLKNYRDLIDEKGTASFGEDKAALEAAYNDLKLSFKDVKGLGAIQAPDVPLIEGSLKDATYAWVGSQIWAKASGGGRINVINEALNQVEKAIQDAGTANTKQLLARNPAYANSSYVQTLVTPLLSTKRFVDINGQAVRVGSIITNSQGQSGRVEQDGSITPLNGSSAGSTPIAR